MIGSLFSSSKIKLKKARTSRYLDKAQEVDVNVFLKHRMSNRIKKVLAYTWEIITENDKWVYFGYIKGHKREKLYVNKIYKTPKKKLLLHFPCYQSFDGRKVWKVISPVFEKLRPPHTHTMIQDYRGYKVFFGESTQIIFHIPWSYSVDGAEEVRMDLEVIINSKDTSKVDVTILNENKSNG